MSAVATAEEMPTRARPRGARRIWIVIAVVAGGLVAANLAARGLDRAVGGNQPGGVAGSSYATAPAGLAAFADLVTQYGHDVTRLRGSLTGHALPTGATAFVLDPDALTANDAATLLQFVTEGGRLVVGGSSPTYLHELSDAPPTWQPFGTTTWTTTDAPLAPAHAIAADGAGSWSAPGRGRLLVGDAGGALLTRDAVGRGEILYLADTSPLANGHLADADNAAFALALAGNAGRPVVFAEGVHGYGTSRGLAALPSRWKIALVLIAVAALAFAWSRARRFGPPDRSSRSLPPARAAYVDALSISLERTGEPGRALEPARQWGRSRVIGRAGLGATADDDEIALAARSFGCDDIEIATLVGSVTDDAAVIALGRALNRLEGGDGRMQ